jgi:hypothetical protein
MIKYFYLFLFCFLMSCSKDDAKDELINQIPNEEYSNIKINGIEDSDKSKIKSDIYKKGDVFNLGITLYGTSFDWNYLSFKFTVDGKLIEAKRESHSIENHDIYYYNYKHFPSNYFDIKILSIDFLIVRNYS